MEGVFGSMRLIEEGERGSPRGMDGAGVIVVNSPSVYCVSQQPPERDVIHSPKLAPSIKRVNLKP